MKWDDADKMGVGFKVGIISQIPLIIHKIAEIPLVSIKIFSYTTA